MSTSAGNPREPLAIASLVAALVAPVVVLLLVVGGSATLALAPLVIIGPVVALPTGLISLRRLRGGDVHSGYRRLAWVAIALASITIAVLIWAVVDLLDEFGDPFDL